MKLKASDHIAMKDKASNKFYWATKRFFDLAVAIVLVIVLFWIFPLLWFVIRFTSEGAPIFAQNRLGKNMRVYKCYKFRTMEVGTPERGTHEISRDSVTNIGRILRATKLDELPQLWNLSLIHI